MFGRGSTQASAIEGKSASEQALPITQQYVDGDPSPSLTNQKPSNYNLSRGGFMANLAGLAGFVSELKTVRTSLVNELRHVDAALSVLGKFGVAINYTTPE